MFVAAARALEAQKPDPLAVDPYAEVFCRAVGGDWADLLDGNCPDHPLASPDFGWHFIDYQAARTRYFDDYFRQALDAGVRQVVILAAGLDSRAYRLSWPEDTTIFVVDRSQVLDFKREVLAEHGARPAAERREVAVDLRDEWPQALRNSGFNAAQPSAWIAEGLLIYLPSGAQQRLFTGIDALSAPGSRLGAEDATPMEPDELAAAIDDELASGDSRRIFHQLIYNERTAPVDQWFGVHGWTTVPTPLADYLCRVGRPLPGPDSQARSMIARNTLVSAAR